MRKSRLISVLLSLSLCSVVAAGNAQDRPGLSDAQIDQAALTGQMDICWHDPIPAGYVIVAEKNTRACDGSNYPGEPDTLTVKEPDPAGEVVCDFPLPTGYVITTDTITTSACEEVNANNTWNALNVKLAGQQEVVCTNSPIPPGYSHSQSYAASQCATGFARTITQN